MAPQWINLQNTQIVDMGIMYPAIEVQLRGMCQLIVNYDSNSPHTFSFLSHAPGLRLYGMFPHASVSAISYYEIRERYTFSGNRH